MRGFLTRRLHDPERAEDLLQDTFVKALAQGAGFCRIDSPRAWLFKVARNTLIDHLRTRQGEPVDIPDDLPDEERITAAVDDLASCLPRALAELPAEDAEAIRLCDLEGMSQVDFARRAGLSLPGAKSRIQRARKRLREHLRRVCQVRFDEDGRVCCFVPRPPAG